MSEIDVLHLGPDDALLVVDLQHDFLPGGSLAVPGGDEVIPVLNRYLSLFVRRRSLIVATRDWHPGNHCSFRAQGGIWPPHCVQHSPGAAFPADLRLPEKVSIISKADTADKDAYSGFAGTELANLLKTSKVQRVFVGGLATDYCVLNTVLDALKEGFSVYVLVDAIRAVNVRPTDGAKAIERMNKNGARLISRSGVG